MSRIGIAKPKKVYVLMADVSYGSKKWEPLSYIYDSKEQIYKTLKILTQRKNTRVAYSIIEGKVIDARF